MFEKEAEEYLDTESKYLIEDNEGNIINIAKKVKQSFKDGAEFGYNKANEWHKQEVDDIYDLISEDLSVRYFICIMKDKSRVTATGNCVTSLFFEHDDEKYYVDDIVWWKEITPPKEIKEND